jgi:hypothetical protein
VEGEQHVHPLRRNYPLNAINRFSNDPFRVHDPQNDLFNRLRHSSLNRLLKVIVIASFTPSSLRLCPPLLCPPSASIWSRLPLAHNHHLWQSMKVMEGSRLLCTLHTGMDGALDSHTHPVLLTTLIAALQRPQLSSLVLSLHFPHLFLSYYGTRNRNLYYCPSMRPTQRYDVDIQIPQSSPNHSRTLHCSLITV